MAKVVLLDEFYLAVSTRAGLPKAAYRAIYRTLRSRSFRSALELAIRQTFRRFPSLQGVRTNLSQ